ncbi:MYXO-CTERM sorting domain-containing protein [Phycisphaeraceae bacterium D3-23]
MATLWTRSSAAAAIAVALPHTAFAGTTVLDFENVSHGDVVTTQNAGVTISADNATNDVDVAVAFDSELFPSFDPDQTFPWSGGNLPSNTSLGNILVIQADGPISGGTVGPGVEPHNEGARPAGDLIFDFDENITFFGLDVTDVDGPEEFQTNSGFNIQFFLNGIEVADVAFGELITPGNNFYDPSIEFGDNTANRISPLTAEQLRDHGFGDAVEFDRVIVSLGGSGAVDNIVFGTDDPPTGVPSPSAALAGLALLGLTIRRRRSA